MGSSPTPRAPEGPRKRAFGVSRGLVGLVRRERSGGGAPFALAEYVNDRPYTASSFLSAPSQIERLRQRSLGHKRSLAVREFGLGVEALERFVRREPLHRVHECVFAVLALESEPVDPRL